MNFADEMNQIVSEPGVRHTVELANCRFLPGSGRPGGVSELAFLTLVAIASPSGESRCGSFFCRILVPANRFALARILAHYQRTRWLFPFVDILVFIIRVKVADNRLSR